MISEGFRDFFVASAGATGALVGLLFVAVSVLPESGAHSRAQTEFRSRSSAALLVFSNALVLSLAALVPQTHLRWWLIIAGAIVLVFAAATARAAVSEARHRRSWRVGSPWLVLALLAIGGIEVFAGLRIEGGDPGVVQLVCYVLIADLAFGIARAWQLLGLRDSGVVESLRILFGAADQPDRSEAPSG